MAVLDESQINQMLIAAKDTRLIPILPLEVTTSMRQMGLLGLKWIDLDWVKQTLKVERQLVRPEEKNLQLRRRRRDWAGVRSLWETIDRGTAEALQSAKRRKKSIRGQLARKRPDLYDRRWEADRSAHPFNGFTAPSS